MTSTTLDHSTTIRLPLKKIFKDGMILVLIHMKIIVMIFSAWFKFGGHPRATRWSVEIFEETDRLQSYAIV